MNKCKGEVNTLQENNGNYSVKMSLVCRLVFALISTYFTFFCPIRFVSPLLLLLLSSLVCASSASFRRSKQKPFSRILFVLLTIYSTFAIFGYDTIFYGAYGTRCVRLLYFVLGGIWTAFVIKAAVGFLDRIAATDRQIIPKEGKEYWRSWFILFLALSASFMVYQRAFNPAIISPDSYAGLAHVIGSPLSDAHPPLHSLMVAYVMKLTGNVACVVYIQIAAFAAILATCLMHVHKQGIKFRYIVPMAICLPLVPSIGLLGSTIWKDIPFSISVLWLTYTIVIICQVVIRRNAITLAKMIGLSIQLCLSLVLVVFLRHGGVIIALVTGIGLLVLFLVRKQWALLVGLFASVAFVGLIQFALFPAMNVVSSQFTQVGKYFAAIHDVQAVYYDGGKLSDDSLAILERSIPQLEERRNDFKRDWVITDYYDWLELTKLTIGEFLRLYLDALFNNPYLTVRAILTRMRAYWVIALKAPISNANYVGIWDDVSRQLTDGSESLNIHRQTNAVTHIVQEGILPVMNRELFATFVWRFGIWVAAMLICIFFCMVRNRHLFLLAFIPVFCCLFTLYLTVGWTDYRYGFPIFLVALFLIPCTVFTEASQQLPDCGAGQGSTSRVR